MKEKVAAYWADRTRRERWTLAVGAAVLIVSFVYAYLWLPMARERERLRVEVPKLRAQLNQMRVDAAAVQRLRASSTTAAPDVKAALDSFRSSEQGRRLAPQVNAEAEGRLRLSMSSVTAVEWLTWISALSAHPGLRIETAQMDALAARGMVKASVLVSNGI